MRSLERLTTFLIVSGGLLLVLSYFLPHEDIHWSPFRMAQGYWAGGRVLEGPVVAAFESSTAACGLILAIAVLLRRSPRTASALLALFLAAWVAVATCFALQFFSLPDLNYPVIYAFAALIVLGSLAGICLHGAFTPSSASTPIVLGLFLAACTLLGQGVNVAYIILEDGLLLNYGAVVSAVGSAVLLVSFLFRHQLHRLARAEGKELLVPAV